MAEYSYFWKGIATGDAVLAPYSDEDYAHLMEIIFQHDKSEAHVFAGIGGDLEVTIISSSSFSVASGFAIVDGKFYENTSGVTFQVQPIIDPNLPGGTEPVNFFRLVGLEKDFANKVVRVFTGQPYDSSALALANIRQEEDVLWQVALAVIAISDNAIVAIEDQRKFIPTAISEGTVARQGGDPYDWTSFGVTDYDPRSVLKQVGVNEFSMAPAASSDTVAITFPQVFSDHPGDTIPLVFLTIISSDILTEADHYIYPSNITAAGFTANIERVITTDAEASILFSWLAIGER